MSSFLCSNQHFQALADILAEAASNKSHIFNHSVSYFMDKCGYDIYQASIREVERAAVEITNKLHELNNLALYGRYGRKYSDMMSEQPPVERIHYSMLNATNECKYKAFSCLGYQCQEDEADGTVLFHWLEWLEGSLAEAIIIHSEAYDATPWEIRDIKVVTKAEF